MGSSDYMGGVRLSIVLEFEEGEKPSLDDAGKGLIDALREGAGVKWPGVSWGWAGALPYAWFIVDLGGVQVPDEGLSFVLDALEFGDAQYEVQRLDVSTLSAQLGEKNVAVMRERQRVVGEERICFPRRAADL